MSAAVPKWVTEWERIRARGAGHFIVVRGLLWAATTTALAVLFMAMTGLLSDFIAYNAPRVTEDIIVLVGAGILWGLTVWLIREARYRRYNTKKKQ